MSATVHVSRNGRLTIVTIDRPEAANALDSATSFALSAAFDDFAADDEQWVAILTATGTRAFCAGTDLKLRASHGRRPLPPTGFGGLVARFDLDKPVIAAVNGAALGGGFELALACDLIVASDTASFALPEVQHGLAALAGGIHRLARQLPTRLAAELIYTGRRLDAAEAMALHLLNAVVPGERLMAEARMLADRILAAAPLAVRASKQALWKGLAHPSVEQALAAQDHWPAVRTMRQSEDAREGAQAFTEKRPPTWSAR